VPTETGVVSRGSTIFRPASFPSHFGYPALLPSFLACVLFFVVVPPPVVRSCGHLSRQPKSPEPGKSVASHSPLLPSLSLVSPLCRPAFGLSSKNQKSNHACRSPLLPRTPAHGQALPLPVHHRHKHGKKRANAEANRASGAAGDAKAATGRKRPRRTGLLSGGGPFNLA